jgi:hypothetical protein
MFVPYDLFLFSHLIRLSSQVVSLGHEKFSGSHLDIMTGWVACGVFRIEWPTRVLLGVGAVLCKNGIT